jgi:hypothetical protein
VETAIGQDTDRGHLIGRLQRLRAIVPVFAEELANSRRQSARLGLENRNLVEQVRELQRRRTDTSDSRGGGDAVRF